MKAHPSKILMRPRITEKATMKNESENIWVFEVSPEATKETIKESVMALWKVMPRKVNITKLPPKNVIKRGKKGVKSGVTKAYVYLKKGDKIELA